MANSFPFPKRAGLRISFNAGFMLLFVFAIVPAIGIFVIAFTDIRSLPYLKTSWVGFDNFVAFFSPARIGFNLRALSNTAWYAIATTVLTNVLGLLVAVLLNIRVPGQAIFRSIVFMPTILGVTVIGLIWTLIFNPTAGPAASLWELFGTDSAFFGDPSLALNLIIFVQIWAGLGVAVVIYVAGLQAISAELYEVAAIDGASAWQRLRYVTIPMLAPSITANVLLSIVGSLQSYQLAYVLTGPNNPATQVLSLVIFSQGFGSSAGPVLSQGYAASISVLQFIVVLVLSLLVLRFLRSREAKL